MKNRPEEEQIKTVKRLHEELKDQPRRIIQPPEIIKKAVTSQITARLSQITTRFLRHKSTVIFWMCKEGG